MIVPEPLASAVSAHVGIVPRVELCLAATSDARFPSCVSWVAADERALGSSIGDAACASGFGRSAAEAASTAVGEALERYSASFVPRERLVHATASELGDEAVRPERFALFAPWQHAQPDFPLQPFHERLRVPWVRGRALHSGADAWLPAELVYLGEVPDAARIGYATSSGAACAATGEEAVVRGLFELLERDAFMIVWRCRLSLPLLEWRGHAKLRALDDRYFAPTGLRYAAVDLSPVHGVPSALGVVGHRAESPGPIGVGAGTAATVGVAWWKALSEAFAAHAAAARLAVLDPEPPAADDVQSFDDHIRYFAFPERVAAAAVPRRVDRPSRRPRRPAAAPRRRGRHARAPRPDRARGLERIRRRRDVARRRRPRAPRRQDDRSRALPPRRAAPRALPRRAPSAPRCVRPRPRAAPADRRGAQPRSSPVSMSAAEPTMQFESLVFGDGIPLDDPAETYHEASRLYPSTARARLPGLALLELDEHVRAGVERSSRRHPERESTALPRPLLPAVSLADVLSRRASLAASEHVPLDLDGLAAILDVRLRSALHAARRPSRGAVRRRSVPARDLRDLQRRRGRRARRPSLRPVRAPARAPARRRSG